MVAALLLELLVAAGRNQHTAVLYCACAVSQVQRKYFDSERHGKDVVGHDGDK